jgi:hypothetical protein
MMVISEITWLTADRPSGLQEYWKNEYPEIDMASSKIEYSGKKRLFPGCLLCFTGALLVG